MSGDTAQKRREFFEQSRQQSIKLNELPTELLERIFYFLPAKTICKDVHATCKRLYNITLTPIFWSSYLKECKGYEPISSSVIESEPWKRAFAFEYEKKRWGDMQSLLRYRSSQAHGATVDALKVHETKNGARFAVSGSRDRSIILWDIKKVADNDAEISTWHKKVPMAHGGWVWTVCVSDNDKSVFSCGFDSMLKQWEIVDGTLQQIRQLNNNNEALLKCIINDNILYTTTFTGKILEADVRVGLETQRKVETGSRNPITCLQSRPDSFYLYAVSAESGNFFCVDKRKMEVVQQCSKFRHCMSIDFDSETLVASWKNGTVKYLNPQTLETEYTWNCPAPSEMRSVNPLRLSKGAFIYGNSYELLIYTPGRNPKLLGKFPTNEMIISVDYNNGDLVCGMSEGVVMFWPRENQTFPLVDSDN